MLIRSSLLVIVTLLNLVLTDNYACQLRQAGACCTCIRILIVILLIKENKMPNTQVRPVRDLRNRYTEIETFLKNHNPVIITKNGKGTAVLINIEDYAEIEDYLHFKFINEKLGEAELEAEKPNVKWIDSKKVIKKMRDKYCGL